MKMAGFQMQNTKLRKCFHASDRFLEVQVQVNLEMFEIRIGVLLYFSCPKNSTKTTSLDLFFVVGARCLRQVALETSEWTSRDSNHDRQFVSAGKTNATPTEPSGRLKTTSLNLEFQANLSFIERTYWTVMSLEIIKCGIT